MVPCHHNWNLSLKKDNEIYVHTLLAIQGINPQPYVDNNNYLLLNPDEQKEFVKDIETMNGSDGLDQLEHRKGRLVVINNILNLETVTHETYEYWLEESKND